MDVQKLVYPTHTLTLEEVENTGFVKATNLVQNKTYQDMVDSIIAMSNHNIHFVSEERKLLSNFVKSLVGFNNQRDNIILETFAEVLPWSR